MEITELGAIGELVGGVAVVGSLIYVGASTSFFRLFADERRPTSKSALLSIPS